jgi:N-acetylglutamate synthase-like GNAT family acetyltransferase
MKFRSCLSPLDIAEQVAGLINSYNGLSYKRTPFDLVDGKVEYVIESHGRWVIGCCGIERHGFAFTEVKHLAVHSEWRKKGVGKFLVKGAIGMCSTPLLYATIRADNPASMGLFLALGFRKSSSYWNESHDVNLLIKENPQWKKPKPDWKSVSLSEKAMTIETPTGS